MNAPEDPAIEVSAVSRERWSDVASLFGASDLVRGCWCAWPRLPYGQLRVGAHNEATLRSVVEGGAQAGFLAYREGTPVGWCAVAPLADFGRFDAAGHEADLLIACLFVATGQRGLGVAAILLSAAVEAARQARAATVGAIPRGWRPDDLGTMEWLRRALEELGFRPDARADAPARYWLTL